MTEEEPYGVARDERAAVHLKAAAAALVPLFVVFTPYNLWMLPAPANLWAGAHDAVVIAVSAAIFWTLHQHTLPRRYVHLVTLGLGLLVASNVALVQILTGAEVQLFYHALLLCSVGVVMTRETWASLALWLLAVVGIGSYLLTWPADVSLVHISFAQFAVSLLSLALVVGRGWAIDRITELSVRERSQEEQLRLALEQARNAERRLDAKVARRTSELRWTNDALRKQIEERQRANSEKEALNQQLQHAQRVEAVGQLTGGVAHDFNNLTTAVIGNVEMAMLDVPRGSPAFEALRDAKTSAVRAAQLTQQLLGFSRVDERAGTSVTVDDAFHGLARVVGRLLGEDVTLRIHTCADDLQIAMPPVQLDQVLLNLVVNARDALPEGGVIDLRAFQSEGTVQVEVRDNGVGMDPATKGRIFEAFFTTKASGKGTGLGLATVHSIVSAHGGSIEVRSVLGEGTTFVLRLPAAEMDVASRRTSIPPVRVPRGRGERVLVVEDEDAVRRIAVRMLQRLGYDAIQAGSGPEALRMLARQGAPIDLLWTDVLMPGMDGKELADRVKAIQPNVHVLFASGYSGDVLAPRGVLPTSTNFLPKPYDAVDVARAVRQALDA